MDSSIKKSLGSEVMFRFIEGFFEKPSYSSDKKKYSRKEVKCLARVINPVSSESSKVEMIVPIKVYDLLNKE